MNAVELIPSQSASANATSAYYDLGGKIDFAIQVSFTGSDVAGVLTLEAAVDPALGWVKVLDSDQTVTSSAGHIWNVTGAGYRYIRIKWAYSSGTGNIKALIYLKD